MPELNLTTIIVAILGSAGLWGAVSQILGGLAKIRRGVAPRERGRRADLIAERDRALARAAAAELAENEATVRAEREARNRWHVEESAARLRRILIEQGLERLLPPPPVIEHTLDGRAVESAREDSAP